MQLQPTITSSEDVHWLTGSEVYSKRAQNNHHHKPRFGASIFEAPIFRITVEKPPPMSYMTFTLTKRVARILAMADACRVNRNRSAATFEVGGTKFFPYLCLGRFWTQVTVPSHSRDTVGYRRTPFVFFSPANLVQ